MEVPPTKYSPVTEKYMAMRAQLVSQTFFQGSKGGEFDATGFNARWTFRMICSINLSLINSGEWTLCSMPRKLYCLEGFGESTIFYVFLMVCFVLETCPNQKPVTCPNLAFQSRECFQCFEVSITQQGGNNGPLKVEYYED